MEEATLGGLMALQTAEFRLRETGLGGLECHRLQPTVVTAHILHRHGHEKFHGWKRRYTAEERNRFMPDSRRRWNALQKISD
ncbi:MAG: hypothetical protein U0894_10175 [Pirellulales bacterium]